MTKISFIVVAYNAAQSLDALLGDLLSQTIAPEQLEALLVDSASTDDTAQIMRRFAARAPFEVKLLENPKRWLASGINVALRAATGDAVIRLDAHARMPKDFLQKNLDALARGEDIVGGSVCGAPPETAWEAVTRALDTSRFCGGAAPFRNGGEARYVDTLAYALYRREVYDRVGLYDERLRRTEDNDMHYRMRKAGYRFFFSPDIVSWHAARKTLRGQLSQPPKDYGKALNKPAAAIVGNVLTNVIARPQFIAYKIGPKPLSVRLCEAMGAVRAGWTSRAWTHEHDYDIVIFEHYRPGAWFRADI